MDIECSISESNQTEPTCIIDIEGKLFGGKMEHVINKVFFKYPVKVISPSLRSNSTSFRANNNNTTSDSRFTKDELNNCINKVFYVLGYGGGMVQGDHTCLMIKLKNKSSVTILTQGFTKIYKTNDKYNKTDNLTKNKQDSLLISKQVINGFIDSQSHLIVLPNPVILFKNSNYNQIQIFRLSKCSSLVLLDWYISGRKNRLEQWVFSNYLSKNSVYIDNAIRINEVTCLLNDDTNSEACVSNFNNDLKSRMDPYHVYGLVLIIGNRYNVLKNKIMLDFNNKVNNDTLSIAGKQQRSNYSSNKMDSQTSNQDNNNIDIVQKGIMIWSAFIAKEANDCLVMKFASTNMHRAKQFLTNYLKMIQEYISIDVDKIFN